MVEEEELQEPNGNQHNAINLRNCEGPLDCVDVFKEGVGQRRDALFGRNPLVHHCDDHRGEHQAEAGVEEEKRRFPPLRRQAVDLGLLHGDLDVVIVPAVAEAPLGVARAWRVHRAGIFVTAVPGTAFHFLVHAVRLG